MDEQWKAYMTEAEQIKIANLEYEIRMIMNRCISRVRNRRKEDEVK